jgi:hypothetical protein
LFPHDFPLVQDETAQNVIRPEVCTQRLKLTRKKLF